MDIWERKPTKLDASELQQKRIHFSIPYLPKLCTHRQIHLKEVLADQYNGPYFSVIAFSTKATLKEIELESDYVEVVYMPQLVKTILANKSAVISTGLS